MSGAPNIGIRASPARPAALRRAASPALVAVGWLMLVTLSVWLMLRVHGPGPRAQQAPEIWIGLMAWAGLVWWALDRLANVAGSPGRRSWASRPDQPGQPGQPGKTSRSLNQASSQVVRLLAPTLLGLALLFAWEVGVVGWDVPRVLLPAPHAVGQALATRWPVLWPDFLQTAQAVLAGYAVGCGSGLAVALLADRVDLLKRGLLPLAGLAGAVPIVGIAPIMVMWFGFDWHSKAAVAAVVTFFPMLVNTLAGLAATDPMQRDLMRTYGAGHVATLTRLRLPSALPFIFNALKINSTLALISAIVAEFFGSPIYGLGFRISAEVARMNVDVVWAAIALAALAGSGFYGLIALVERRLTFWHPSYRA